MKYVQVTSRAVILDHVNSQKSVVAVENVSMISLESDKNGLYRVWLNGNWIDVDRADQQKILRAMGLT